jgi:hypothetical protein
MKLDLPSPHPSLTVTQSYGLKAIWFSLESLHAPALPELEDFQTRSGYSPMGYGLYNRKTDLQPSGRYLTTWSCSDSCD